MSYSIAVEGLEALRLFDDLPPRIERAAVRAINKTAPRARTAAARGVLAEVNFPASYLNPSQGRLVARKARRGHLEGAVSGRVRPTSLARFTKDKPLLRGQKPRKGVRVEVHKGKAHYKLGAFLIPLRSGGDGSLGNVGLAVRSEVSPPKAYRPKKIGKNLWLLYGPSVNQVLYSLRNQRGVIEDIAPETLNFLNKEFLRLLDLEIARG
jgi:hypothetical protein